MDIGQTYKQLRRGICHIRHSGHKEGIELAAYFLNSQWTMKCVITRRHMPFVCINYQVRDRSYGAVRWLGDLLNTIHLHLNACPFVAGNQLYDHFVM